MKKEEMLRELQSLEQNLQQYALQKREFQSQLIELESALTELADTTQAYKIVGNIMVNTSREQLQNDLSAKRDVVQLRIKTLEKQEQRLNEKAKELRTNVMGALEHEGK